MGELGEETNGKFGQLARLRLQKMETGCGIHDGVYDDARTLKKC